MSWNDLFAVLLALALLGTGGVGRRNAVEALALLELLGSLDQFRLDILVNPLLDGLFHLSQLQIVTFLGRDLPVALLGDAPRLVGVLLLGLDALLAGFDLEFSLSHYNDIIWLPSRRKEKILTFQSF